MKEIIAGVGAFIVNAWIWFYIGGMCIPFNPVAWYTLPFIYTAMVVTVLTSIGASRFVSGKQWTRWFGGKYESKI